MHLSHTPGQGLEIPEADKEVVPLWDGGTNDLCQVCSWSGNVLCCSYCNLVYHMRCLMPPRKRIPKVRRSAHTTHATLNSKPARLVLTTL